MNREKARDPRRYHAPVREQSAQRTRLLIIKAAKATFEKQGWSGATMGTIAVRARLSQSTVEAVFRTKAALLQATVDYAIRGDIDPTPIRGREITNQIEAAPDAISMLELHAGHLRTVHDRSAHLFCVVEQAAPSDKNVRTLWQRMNTNRRDGVEWAARILLSKPDTGHLMSTDVERTFWVALDSSNYRLLTGDVGLTPDQYERWILDYYLRMFGLGRTA